jgi:hypothetical protein
MKIPVENNFIFGLPVFQENQSKNLYLSFYFCSTTSFCNLLLSQTLQDKSSSIYPSNVKAYKRAFNLSPEKVCDDLGSLFRNVKC